MILERERSLRSHFKKKDVYYSHGDGVSLLSRGHVVFQLFLIISREFYSVFLLKNILQDSSEVSPCIFFRFRVISEAFRSEFTEFCGQSRVDCIQVAVKTGHLVSKAGRPSSRTSCYDSLLDGSWWVWKKNVMGPGFNSFQ